MKLKFQFTIAFMLSLLSLICFSGMALLINGSKIVAFDRSIISLIQGFETPGLTTIMKCFTFIGSTPSVAVISLFSLFFLYKVLKHRTELILFIAIIVGSPILNELLKLLFHRARPDFHRLIEINGYSFPSGHAMSAFAVYGVLSFLLWRHISTRWGRTLLIVITTTMILAK